MHGGRTAKLATSSHGQPHQKPYTEIDKQIAAHVEPFPASVSDKPRRECDYK